MQVHFYTSLNNIREIESGKRAKVWTKAKAKESDIHISMDTKLHPHHLYKTSVDNVFEIQKRRHHGLLNRRNLND